jgi:predicted unusual protein kinase regulating ubiquinone biosynthesis (AarF/ABC1/UbiB family)
MAMTQTTYSNLPTFNQLSRYLNGLLFISYLVFILFVESFFYFMDKNYHSFIQRIAYKLSRVNILYVKLFQAIALNRQYIDESLNQFLLTFTDNSPWCLDDIDYETLIGITNDYNIVLQDGFEKPMNTGMVSLVFKGTMDSSPVVIKIKRRNIQFKLECAIENVLCLLSLLSFIPFIQKYDIESLVTRNIYLIREQLDFSKEVTNMLQVKENFTHFKYIKIPTVYQIQYPNAIIMEYIEGKSITDVNPEDYEHFAKQILKFGTVSILIHGLSHGDLHAGNILFIKDDKETFDKHKYILGILDFGIVYSIEKKFQEVLYDIMDGLTVVDKSVLAKKIIDSGMFIEPIETIRSLPIKDYENIISMLSNILADVFAINDNGSDSGLGNCNQIKFYYFIRDFHKYMSTFLPQYHLTMTNNVIKTQLALAMTHGVTMKLCKDNWTLLFSQVMIEMFHTDIFKE